MRPTWRLFLATGQQNSVTCAVAGWERKTSKLGILILQASPVRQWAYWHMVRNSKAWLAVPPIFYLDPNVYLLSITII
jgi:hypothetical protein